jgi:hypothetical protein
MLQLRDSQLVMIDMQCGTEDLFPVKEHQNDTQWSTEKRSSLSENGQDDRRKADAQQLHIKKPYLIGLPSLNALVVTLYTTGLVLKDSMLCSFFVSSAVVLWTDRVFIPPVIRSPSAMEIRSHSPHEPVPSAGSAL